jgi:hypothetical protein
VAASTALSTSLPCTQQEILHRERFPLAREQTDFCIFRTRRSSLIAARERSFGSGAGNMDHSEIATTANIYSKSWLDERAEAVIRVVGRSDER